VLKLVEGIENVVGGRTVGDLFGEVPIALGTTFPTSTRFRPLCVSRDRELLRGE
jgi:hypothetical protein